jgi:hypothetical protein
MMPLLPRLRTTNCFFFNFPSIVSPLIEKWKRILYFVSNAKKKHLKVVHIIEALGGGVYTHFEDLTHHFEKRNHSSQTYILYSDNRKEIDPEKK